MLGGQMKLRQDLGILVREALGEDRFHPRWGTELGEYIGMTVSSQTKALIQGEISRIIHNYMMIQGSQIEADLNSGKPPRHISSEILTGIEKIEVQQWFDRLNVKVTVRTFDGKILTLFRTVGV